MKETQRSRNPTARRLAIQRRLLLEGTVTVDTLSQELGSSVATIRRDLTILEEEGAARRTHGGAVIKAPRGADQAFALRETLDAEAKRWIARQALELLEPDQTVLVNDGSTALAFARELVAARIPLTVATPGVNVATYLSQRAEITVYLLGGRVRHQTLGTSGEFAEQMLKAINADIAFVAAEGFSIPEGLSYSYESDARLARLMHEKAMTTVVLATARKLGQRDRFTAIPANRADVLISDCGSSDLLAAFRDHGIKVIGGTDDLEPLGSIEKASIHES